MADGRQNVRQDNLDDEQEPQGNGKKIALIVTLAMVLLVGLRVYVQYRRNHETGPAAGEAYVKPKLTDDQMASVKLRKQYPSTLKDERELIGKPLWVQAGGQLDYYPYANRHADYTHRAGTLDGAEELLVKDVFEQVAPSSGRAIARFPAGQRHVLIAFTLPASANPKAEYATPIGNFDQGSYTFQSDNIFFYDDPRQIYAFWGPAMWQAIDKHQAVAGMSENQAMMSMGEVIVPSSDDFGNRTVRYDNNDHPVKVVFKDDKAVSITPEQP